MAVFQLTVLRERAEHIDMSLATYYLINTEIYKKLKRNEDEICRWHLAALLVRVQDTPVGTSQLRNLVQVLLFSKYFYTIS